MTVIGIKRNQVNGSLILNALPTKETSVIIFQNYGKNQVIMPKYDLILSHNPCDIFNYYKVEEMHGLNLKDCKAYNNTPNDSYICGWCNYVPKPDQNYKSGDKMFVFINLSRCGNDLDLITTLYHELMHYSFAYYNWNINYEEEMITLAEQEVKRVYQICKVKTD